MKVILSIKPYYAEKILSGEKLYELRKAIFKLPDVEKVVVYASSPISRIIGEFEIEEILHEDIAQLWKKTKEHSAVDEAFFYNYFADRTKGYAIKVKNTKKYKNSFDIMERYGVKAPQSFSYIYE